MLFADIDAPGWAIILGAAGLIVKMVLDFFRDRDKVRHDKEESRLASERDAQKAARDAETALKVEGVRLEAQKTALKVEEVRLQAIIAASGVAEVKETLETHNASVTENMGVLSDQMTVLTTQTNGLMEKIEAAGVARGVKQEQDKSHGNGT